MTDDGMCMAAFRCDDDRPSNAAAIADKLQTLAAVTATLRTQVAAVTEERDFLLRRVELSLTGDYADEVGRSSNALVVYAFGGPEPTTFNYPHDRGDLARCERTRAVAPASLHQRMDYLLAKYREHLAGRGWL